MVCFCLLVFFWGGEDMWERQREQERLGSSLCRGCAEHEGGLQKCNHVSFAVDRQEAKFEREAGAG